MGAILSEMLALFNQTVLGEPLLTMKSTCSSNVHTHNFHVAIRHLHAQAHITPVDSESYNFKKRQKRQKRQNLKKNVV